MKVGIIDYGVGNLGSVVTALHELKAKPQLLTEARDLAGPDFLILPGVGSFTEGMQLLNCNSWSTALKDEVVGKSKPLLGICLGMQLLAEFGTEGSSEEEPTLGLGLIPGMVKALKSLGCTARLPHMGWNSIELVRDCELLKDIPGGTDFYFVHSYTFCTKEDINLFARTNYEVPVAAVVGREHIWGTQFHPEKSSRAGFRLLKNFIRTSYAKS